MNKLKPFNRLLTREVCLQAVRDEVPEHLLYDDLADRMAATIPTIASAVYNKQFPDKSMTASEMAHYIVRTIQEAFGIKKVDEQVSAG